MSSKPSGTPEAKAGEKRFEARRSIGRRALFEIVFPDGSLWSVSDEADSRKNQQFVMWSEAQPACMVAVFSIACENRMASRDAFIGFMRVVC